MAGTVLRFASIMLWPADRQVFLSTLLVVGLGCLLLGWLSRISLQRHAQAFLIGFASSAASLSFVAFVAVSSSPLQCAFYVTAVPAAAIIGLLGGVVVGAAMRRETDIVDDP